MPVGEEELLIVDKEEMLSLIAGAFFYENTAFTKINAEQLSDGLEGSELLRAIELAGLKNWQKVTSEHLDSWCSFANPLHFFGVYPFLCFLPAYMWHAVNSAEISYHPAISLECMADAYREFYERSGGSKVSQGIKDGKERLDALTAGQKKVTYQYLSYMQLNADEYSFHEYDELVETWKQLIKK